MATTKSASLPPLSAFQPYADAEKSIGDLQAAQHKITSRLAELDILLQQSAPETKVQSVDDALAFAQTGKVFRPTRPEVSGLMEERTTLRQHEQSIREAINRQTADLYQLRSSASQAVCRDLSARHKAIAARYLDKLRELDQLAEEEDQMVREIEAAGYSASFPESIVWHQLGRLADPHSMVSMRAKELSLYA